MANPNQLKYSKQHEWLKLEGNVATIGITEYAAEQLGDVVHVDLPEIDAEFGKEDSIGTVESVKSVSDIYAPVSGKVIEVNEHLTDNPGNINHDAYGEGWICKIEISDPAEVESLLSMQAYEKFLADEA